MPANTTGTIAASGTTNAVALGGLIKPNMVGTFLLSGTFTGVSVQIQGLGLDGIWHGVLVKDLSTGLTYPGKTAIALTNSTEYSFVGNFEEFSDMRVYASAYSSGTLDVFIQTDNYGTFLQANTIIYSPPSSVTLSALGFLATSPTVGVGYTTGAGGTVTQLTSKSTGVTLNTTTGQVVMNGAALAGATSVTFTLTNSSIGAYDVPVVAIASGATANDYLVSVGAVAAGSCAIALYNSTASTSRSDTVVLNFAIIKGSIN